MISKFSVKKAYTVLVGVIMVIVLGIVSFMKMTTDLLPSISLPYVIVMTTYPGANPETVEMVVTQPVEASMATVSNVEGISSVSGESYSMVIMEFAQSADMNAVSLEIRENLDQITPYWDDSVGSPIIMKLNPDMLPVMIAAVGVDGMDTADVSTYVQDSVMPELESIEGVASVSATGLLEESVNVIIRQEKIDLINEMVFASIDEEMKEAEEELADGRKELEDGKKELADGKQELADSWQELLDGKQEIIDGKAELEEGKEGLSEGEDALQAAQKEATQKLAEAKNQLLTQKTQLEATKAGLTTNLTTAEKLNSGIVQLDESLSQMDSVVNAGEGFAQIYAAYETALAGGDVATAEAMKAQITAMRDGYVSSDALAQMAAQDTTGMLSSAIAGLSAIPDWAADAATAAQVEATLDGIGTQLTSTVETQKATLQNSLNNITNGLSYDEYKVTIDASLAQINTGLAQVDAGLAEVEKGQMDAAIQMAGASSQIAFGKYQINMAESQLDAAEEQIKTGEEQLTDAEEQMKEAEKQLLDAEEQLKEGEEQLADAKENAYNQANMHDILTVDTVKSLLTAQNFSMPAGYVTEDGIDYMVRLGDKPTTVDELKAMPLMNLNMDGVPVITLGDVADVFYTDNSNEIYANVDGSAGVMITMQKQTGYSTGEVSDLLEEKFEEMMEENQDLTIITLMDQGIYIDLVMDSIINNILFGGLLAVFILLIFLKDLRPTLVVAFSIPISLVAAIACMYFSGVTLNVISLSGLALGIGMLVDNSIVVIENIYRLRSEGYSMKEAAIEGAKEVAGAIAASTLTTICVFAPIIFTEGITRQLFVDMGLTIAYSLVASLVIALTVVPAMASKMLTKTKEQQNGRLFEGLLNIYEKVLGLSLKVKPLVFILVIALLIGSAAMAMSRGTAFMPEMDSTQLSVSLTLDKDATLEETAEVTNEVIDKIFEIEDVDHIGAMTNSSSASMMGMGGSDSTNATTIYVVTKEDKTRTNIEIAEIIREKTAHIDVEMAITTSDMDMSALGGSGVSIQVRGRDLDTLQSISKDIAAIIAEVEGTTDVSDGLGEAEEEVRIIIDRDKAIDYGLTVAQVFTQVNAKLADPSNATTLVAVDKDYNVYVTHGSDSELTRDTVKEVEILGTDEDGQSVKVPLSEIATFETAQALTAINRADQTRYISVTAAIADGYNVGLVSADIEEALQDYTMPEGYSLVFSGENEMIMEAMEQLMLMLVLALVFMYLIMVAQFQSLLSPFIIMFTIPLAFTGGFLGLYLTGSEVSVIAVIGFIMLAGVIVNNGIVMIDYMNQLRESGMEKKEAILTAGRTRLRPVLMTALTTILAMSTMVFSNDMGAELAKPMAVVTIGGLLYGTLLTLIVIPCVYDVFTGKGKKKMEDDVEITLD